MSPTENPTAGSLPIGSVICFAGDLSVAEQYDRLRAAGWLLCDGADLQESEYPALFAAIGTNNGSPGPGRFNLPDLQDRFVRGRNAGASAGDPDAAQRTAAQAGGATGDRVGSLQASATALPTTTPFSAQKGGAHTHTIPHLTRESWPAWRGSTYTMALGNSEGDTDSEGGHLHKVTGLEGETIPVNMTLYYVIKAVEPAQADGTTPAGAMAGAAGESVFAASAWLPCDGMSYGTPLYPNLNALISYNYGGDGVSVFNVPDLRGKFMRGTSHGIGRDPDAAARFAPATGGASGDATGSAQNYATSCSTLRTEEAGDHQHHLARVPHQYHNVAYGASGVPYCMVWTDATTTSEAGGEHTHSITGGDKETRPQNVYLDWRIASDHLPGAPPVGSILPIGADTTNLSTARTLMDLGWLPCNGDRLTISDPAYNALYDTIGTTYGGARLQFFLPDLRGYFVRGAGKSKAGVVQKQSHAGKPVTPMQTSTDGEHTHAFANVPNQTHVIDVVLGKLIAEHNPSGTLTSTAGRHGHEVSGGDRESRPVNVYVDYVIRYR